jgi:adenine-specific DNA-methyltransferase
MNRAQKRKLAEAREVLAALALPRAQQNDRSALTLLALADQIPGAKWSQLARPLLGVTPIMTWIAARYGLTYAPNTRETIRRLTLHQFVDAGIALYNPDKPERPVNSPKAVYQLAPEVAGLLAKLGQPGWLAMAADFVALKASLAERYGEDRTRNMVLVQSSDGPAIRLSPGPHSQLIAAIVGLFIPAHAPSADVIYVGDTGDKHGFLDKDRLASLGVSLDARGKMPDVVLYDADRHWLILIESVTSHGPVDGKRKFELEHLFAAAEPGLVHITAFPDRQTMARYLSVVAWETEVWIADNPSHLIHFNGDRFLGPH